MLGEYMDDVVDGTWTLIYYSLLGGGSWVN
jgi:hypothetical protein